MKIITEEKKNNKNQQANEAGRVAFVSVIVPCLNEELYIEKCLDSMLSQDYPKEKLEILIVDGGSTDRTKDLINNYISNKINSQKTDDKNDLIKILYNPKKFASAAWNIGINNSKGDVVIYIGAHAEYQKDYISKSVKYLYKYNVDNVGGIIKTLPSKNTLIARSISFCLSSFFGAGNSTFRIGSSKKELVDTVFGGCYKKEVFKKIGMINEKFIRSSDMDFNTRLRDAGGKILLCPDIIVYYYPKDNLKDFFFHNIKDGIWVTYPLKFFRKAFKIRHFIPFLFVLSLLTTSILGFFIEFFMYIFLLIIMAYILINLFFSFKIMRREKDFRLFFTMSLIFSIRHIAYGLGSFLGIVKILKD